MRPSNSNVSRLSAIAAAVALVLAACGGGDDDAADPPTTDPPTTSVAAEPTDGGSQGPGASVDASIDACALLSETELETLVEFEFGGGTWAAADDPDAGTCSWTNEEQATTITVEVYQGIDEVLDGISAGTGTIVEDVPVGAATAVGVRDEAADRLLSLAVPAGADSVIKVVQSPLKLADEALVSVAESAALAFENGAGGSSASSDDPVEGDLESVRFTVQSSDAGIDLEFEVTAQEVVDAGNAITTSILCAGVEEGDTGIFEGVYAVSAIDADRDPGLVSASVESGDDVDGPGTYQGSFSARDSKGRAVEVDGELTIDDGMRSGELLGADEAGNDVAVTWECRPLG